MKDDEVKFDYPYIEEIPTPERKLWMAVIERALKDYCFFFSNLNKSGKSQILNYNKKHTINFTLRAIKELNRLRWFLFCKEPEEFNLTMLTIQFYDNDEEMAGRIRQVASQQFKRNLDDAINNSEFADLVKYVKQFTAADNWEAASEYIPLKTKRYTN